MKAVGKWGLNILIAIDQLGNAIGGGDPDETISSRIGKIKKANGGKIPWTHPVSKIIDAGLEKIDPGHSIRCIEADEGCNEV